MGINTYIISFHKCAQFILTVVVDPLAITLHADFDIQLSMFPQRSKNYH
jgi:hypothetical protein